LCIPTVDSFTLDFILSSWAKGIFDWQGGITDISSDVDNMDCSAREKNNTIVLQWWIS
jgi:hypothetical protein